MTGVEILSVVVALGLIVVGIWTILLVRWWHQHIGADLEREIDRLQAELKGERKQLYRALGEVERLREKIDFLLSRAAPVPSEEPEEGVVGMVLYMSVAEWRWIRGTTEGPS